jgi:hypothetical protein
MKTVFNFLLWFAVCFVVGFVYGAGSALLSKFWWIIQFLL